jgi:hypothetical protein
MRAGRSAGEPHVGSGGPGRSVGARRRDREPSRRAPYDGPLTRPRLTRLRARLAQRLAPGSVAQRFAPGHFYSPVPDPRELARDHRHGQVWPAQPRETPGIDWNDDVQLQWCERLAAQERLAFDERPPAGDDGVTYFMANSQYPGLDAWVLEGLLRHLRPRRLIDVGAGHSTRVIARVNRELLSGAMAVTSIDPHPAAGLADLPGAGDVRPVCVQDAPLDVFAELGDGDVLFVDSSHVAKTGSDVVWLFQEVLPRLRSGVFVHLHDMFVPWDYPEPWVAEGRGWNELYVARAFLAFNDAFAVQLAVQHLLAHHRAALGRALPALEDPAIRHWGGSSLWLRRR